MRIAIAETGLSESFIRDLATNLGYEYTGIGEENLISAPIP